MERTLVAESNEALTPSKQTPIFALDIGTHSIIGIVGMATEEVFHVMAMEQLDHTRRVMVDGQIEDIDGVAATADLVRKRLEEKLGLQLKDVCVAAAGRALKTQRATYAVELNSGEQISSRQIMEMELGAIQQAETQVMGEAQQELSLFCVGHSVTRYTLDGYNISTLLSHHGKRAEVEIIATFLPGEVVESLYTTMRKIGLSVTSMTLEPIAAMNAIIPRELRMLNLALVDIGAGTSDIAVSDEGSVTAYTMATIAGDEITETIVREYLVDFETAERMKLELSEKAEQFSFQDILGISYLISQEELLGKIHPAMVHLATEICTRISEANNGKPPAAVFMVGGGSQLPGLCSFVAETLTLEERKVAIGGNNYMKKMVTSEINIAGPEFATPIGIALTAMQQREQNGFTVTLNGKKTHVYKAGQATVMDLLLMNGYKQSQLIGRSGKSVTFELDGRRRVIRGGYAIPAVIRVNGEEANISTPVGAEDQIELVKAVNGTDAAPTIQEMVEDFRQLEMTVNGEAFLAGTKPFINGEPIPPDYCLQDLDRVEIHEIWSVADLCTVIGIDPQEHLFYVNDCRRDEDYLLAQGDELIYDPMPAHSQAQPTEPPPAIIPPTPPQQATEEDAAVSQPFGHGLMRVLLNGREVELPPKADGAPHLFVDMLNYVDIDPSKPQGNIILRLNGRNASYLEPIRGNDSIEIYWDK